MNIDRGSPHTTVAQPAAHRMPGHRGAGKVTSVSTLSVAHAVLWRTPC
ncbi:hypothetical protein ABT126_18785 [Streptomyces sp. NPDC002012]